MDTFTFHERWTLTASGRYNDAQCRHPGPERHEPGAGRGPRIQAVQSRARAEFQPDRRADGVRELQRGHAGADRDGADLRRPHSPVQAAEQLPGRSTAEDGGRQDDRDRGARQARRYELERGDLPHRPARRHPVHQQRQRHQRRLLPERRQDPAPGDRADGSDEVGPARHRRPLWLHRRDLPQRLRRAQSGQFERGRQRRHRRRERQPHPGHTAAHPARAPRLRGERSADARRQPAWPTARSDHVATRTTRTCTASCPAMPC